MASVRGELLPIPALLERACRRHPSRPLASFPEATMTYGELEFGARARAAELARLGVVAGDHVGILMPDGPALIEALAASWMLGAVPVPFHLRSQDRELRHLVEHSDVVALLVTAPERDAPVDLCARLESAFPELIEQPPRLPGSLLGVLVEGPCDRTWATSRELELSADAPSGWRDAGWEEPALILYTSGTTALPKGCILTHGSLVPVCVGATRRIGFTDTDIVWSPTPLFHIGAFVCLIGTIAVGAEYLGAPHFDAQETFELLAARNATVAYGTFPPFYAAIAALDDYRPESLPDLRVLTTAASPHEIEQVRRDFPQATQVSVFGSTETSGTVALSALDDPPAVRATTCGRPLDEVEIETRDPATHAPTPACTPGEIWIRGACLLAGYHRDPVDPRDPEGWFRTGDLGVFDMDGNLAFRGRLKDMLKVGGENVSPVEVEDFLLGHRDVVAAQVVGMPDGRLGEVPVAFVELRRGGSVEPEHLISMCEGRLARFKIPRRVVLVDAWPRSATKIDKQALRRRAAELVADEAVA